MRSNLCQISASLAQNRKVAVVPGLGQAPCCPPTLKLQGLNPWLGTPREESKALQCPGGGTLEQRPGGEAGSPVTSAPRTHAAPSLKNLAALTPGFPCQRPASQMYTLTLAPPAPGPPNEPLTFLPNVSAPPTLMWGTEGQHHLFNVCFTPGSRK